MLVARRPIAPFRGLLLGALLACGCGAGGTAPAVDDTPTSAGDDASTATKPAGPSQDSSPSADGGANDAALPDTCDLSKSFGAPVPIGIEGGKGITAVLEAAMTPDEKNFFVNAPDITQSGNARTLAFSRPNRTAPFSAPIVQEGLYGNWDPAGEALWVDADGLTAYVAGSVASMTAQFDIKRIVRFSRPSVAAVWQRSSQPVPALAPDGNYSVHLETPFVTGLQKTLYYARRDVGSNSDLFRTDLPAPAPVALAEINTPGREENPVLSADELTIYWATSRGYTDTIMRVWTAHRASKSDAFAEAHAVDGVKPPSTATFDARVVPIAVSTNQCRLYVLESDDAKHITRIGVATRLP